MTSPATDPAPEFNGAIIRQSSVRKNYMDNMPASSFYLFVCNTPDFPRPVDLPLRITYYSKSEIEDYFTARGRRDFMNSVGASAPQS